MRLPQPAASGDDAEIEDEDFDPDVEIEDIEMVWRDHLMSQSP